MQSFSSLPSPATVSIFLYYVPIYIASPASQDATLASLLVLGLCFQTLWACVGAVWCFYRFTQVGGGVVALCPGQSSHWQLQVLNTLFKLVPDFHGHGWLFACGLHILLQPLLWFGNWLPPSMGQLQGFWNRHVRTTKTFPYFLKSFPLSHWRFLEPQIGNHFCTQRKVKA